MQLTLRSHKQFSNIRLPLKLTLSFTQITPFIQREIRVNLKMRWRKGSHWARNANLLNKQKVCCLLNKRTLNCYSKNANNNRVRRQQRQSNQALWHWTTWSSNQYIRVQHLLVIQTHRCKLRRPANNLCPRKYSWLQSSSKRKWYLSQWRGRRALWWPSSSLQETNYAV